MRKPSVLAAILFVLTTNLAAQETSPDESFQRAIALHDAGDYDGAIAIYRDLLAKMPDNEKIKYELTYSTFAKGDMDETIRLAKAGAERVGPTQVRYLELLGNAYDGQHKTRDAIAAYKRGIKVDPRDRSIRFNLGVAYIGQNRLRDARQEFERTIALDPTHASPQFAIGDVYRMDGYRVPAILAYGRFLSLESGTARVFTAAQYLQTLLNLGVTAEGKGNVNITIDPHPKKDLGDFSALEMMAALASGASHLPENQAKSEFDRQAETLSLFVTMFAEGAADLKRGFVATTYAPFYASMVKAGHGSTFAHLALASLKLPGTGEWMAAHKAEVSAFNAWLGDAVKR